MSATSKGASLLQYKLVDGECHGYVAEYHLATSLINSQIDSLAKRGYTWLRLCIPYWHGLNDGLTMDSTGGTLSPQQMSNLAAVISYAKSAGFEHVMTVLLPEGPDDSLHNWKSWDEAYYEESWILTCAIRKILAAGGLPFVIEMNEGVWDPSTLWGQFNKRWWIDYTSTFGDRSNGNHVDDATVSFVPTQMQWISEIFSGNLPGGLFVHEYHDQDFPGATCVADVHRAVKARMYTVPGSPILHVGETFCDYTTLRELGNFNPPVIIEWPLTADGNVVQNVIL